MATGIWESEIEKEDGGYTFQNKIYVNTDYGLAATIKDRDLFLVAAASVTDNAGAPYTNTGQTFYQDDEIYWDVASGTYLLLGSRRIFNEDSTDIFKVNTALNIDTTGGKIFANRIDAGDGSGLLLYDDGNNLGLHIDDGGRVGVGITPSTALLDVKGSYTFGLSLRLRSGDLATGFDSNQIVLSYNNSVNYSHSIKSRHNATATSSNAIDFFVWDQTTDAAGDIGTKHVMTLNGDGYAGINETTPTHHLHVEGNGYFANELGIGITPTAQLDVYKDNAFQTITAQFKENSNDLNMIYECGSGQEVILKFFESGSPKYYQRLDNGDIIFDNDLIPNIFVMTQTGTLGIGEASPAAKLDFGTNTGHLIRMATDGYIGIDNYNSFRHITNGILTNASGNMYLNIDSNNDSSGAKFEFAKDRIGDSGGTVLMTLNEGGFVELNGKLAIGTTVTAYDFEVTGNSIFNGATDFNGNIRKKVTVVNQATFSMQTDDYYLSVIYTPTGTVDITLPAGSSLWNATDGVGAEVEIADSAPYGSNPNAGTNRIRVFGNGSDTLTNNIAGNAYLDISTDGGVMVLQLEKSGTNYIWKVK